MTGGLDRLCNNYDSGAATVCDGENDRVMAVSPKMIARADIWPVKVVPFYRECRKTTMMMNLQMKWPAQK